jgi:hypothetical protein
VTRFERWAVLGTSLLTFGTGAGYFWTKYLVRPSDPFSVVNHPLEPWFLKAHILVSPALVFAVGLIATRHVWQHLRCGVRAGRRTGLVLAGTLAPMVGTGYALQVVTHVGWLRALAIAHVATGTVFAAALALHRWRAGRRASGEGNGRGARARTHPGEEARAPAAVRAAR